jgi:hypothetical protein
MNHAGIYECYSRGGPQQEQSEAGYAIGEDRQSRSQRQYGHHMVTTHRLDSFLIGRIPRAWNRFVPLSGYLRTAFKSLIRAQ